MKLFVLLLLTQQQVNIVPSVRAAVLQPDGGVVDVGAGAWFSQTEIIEMGKDHAGLRKENEMLKAAAADTPYAWMLVAIGAGLVVGTVTGFFAARSLPR